MSLEAVLSDSEYRLGVVSGVFFTVLTVVQFVLTGSIHPETRMEWLAFPVPGISTGILMAVFSTRTITIIQNSHYRIFASLYGTIILISVLVGLLILLAFFLWGFVGGLMFGPVSLALGTGIIAFFIALLTYPFVVLISTILILSLVSVTVLPSYAVVWIGIQRLDSL